MWGGGGGGASYFLGLGTQISNRATGSVSNGGLRILCQMGFSGFVNSRKIWYWYYMLVSSLNDRPEFFSLGSSQIGIFISSFPISLSLSYFLYPINLVQSVQSGNNNSSSKFECIATEICTGSGFT